MSKIRNWTLVLLFVVTFIGVVFRFYKLAQYPVSLSIDEVTIGYNAYSILKTGKDEFGEKLPLAFRSIGDYKPPVLIYMMVPAIALFDLTEFGTRFTVAFFAVLTIPLVFFTARYLTRNVTVALLAAFLLAISPWHVELSRSTFEAVLALFFVLLGVALFFCALGKNRYFLVPAVISFAVSIYTYHAERVFTPLFALLLFFFFKKQVLAKRKPLLIAVIIGFLFMVPYLQMAVGDKVQRHAKNQFITRDTTLYRELHKPDEDLSVLQMAFDNNLVMIGSYWAKRYLHYLDPQYLFVSGLQYTHPKNFDQGIFYFWELPFLLIGLYTQFVAKKFPNRGFIATWLLLGPLTASLTINEQHPLRSLTTIPMPQIIGAIGLYQALLWLKRRRFVHLSSIAAASLIAGLSVLYYWNIYTVQFPSHHSELRMYGMKEASLYAWQHQNEYDEIVVDPLIGTEGPFTYGIPYAYILFYGKYPPEKFQTAKRRLRYDKYSVNFENYTFRKIYWPEDRLMKNRLYIGSPWSLPKQDIALEQFLKVIPFKNTVDGFYIVSTKN